MNTQPSSTKIQQETRAAQESSKHIAEDVFSNVSQNFSQYSSSGVPHQLKRPEDYQNVKLFLGQLPNSMEEDQLTQMFSPFGEITGIKILKDRITGMHKGCAFLTFKSKESCDMAIAALHNKKTFPPAKNPIQVKYAEGQLERFENKLFIGQIPKDRTEEDIQAVFAPFGEIDSINLLKDSGGVSKGCCFVKFKTRDAAAKAIHELSNYTFDGDAPTPLVVKWADSPQQRNERNQRKMAKVMNVPMMYPANMTTYYPVQGMIQIPYGYYSPYFPQAAPMGVPYQPMQMHPQQLPMNASPPENGMQLGNLGPPGSNMYIPHLRGPNYTEEELLSAFAPMGIEDSYGYISYEESLASEAAQNVVSAMSGFMGRPLPSTSGQTRVSLRGEKQGDRAPY